MVTEFSIFAAKRRVKRARNWTYFPQIEALEERWCPSGGSVEWSDPSISGSAFCMAVQPDGRIVAGGNQEVHPTPVSSAQNSALFRFNSDGTPDSTFGSGGVVLWTAKGSTYGPTIFGVAIQTDGKIVAAAAYPAQQFQVMRFNPNGSLDTTFGAGKKPTGVVNVTVSPVANAWCGVSGVALQGDGKIVIAGTCPNGPTSNDFAVIRLTTSGALDSTFGSGGIVTTDLAGDDNSKALTIQGDGKILLAGVSRSASGAPWYEALVRYNSNGTLDTSFGSAGKVLFQPPGTNDALAGGVAVQGDGNIVVSGAAGSYPGDGFFAPLSVARFTPSGQLDTTFGNSGFATASGIYGDESNVYTRIAVDAYGGLVVNGTDTTGQSDWHNFVVARFLSTGGLDASFGINGVAMANLGASALARAMALQSHGDIVVVGTSGTTSGNATFALVSFQGGTTTSLAATSTLPTSPTTNTASSTQNAANLDAFWASDAEALSFTDKLIGATAA